MVDPKLFIQTLEHSGVDFFTGVPDSLLKNLCAYLTDHCNHTHHIIAANEGGAVGLAAGYHLATGRMAMVYMQNSGEGNAINPLLSLTDEDVYGIPVLLLIGWRGEPGVHDEPQHLKQGKVTLTLLEAMHIDYEVLSDREDEAILQVDKAVEYMRKYSKPYALVVRKNTFSDYQLTNRSPEVYPMSREAAIQLVVDRLPVDAVVVSTTGMISRELFEYREAKHQGHAHDFLTVGSMGHASQIALGIALQHPDRLVFCFDGDGAMLMHLGAMAIMGEYKPSNMVHIVFNNGAHDSVGGQPTVGQTIDAVAIARAVGYESSYSVDSRETLIGVLDQLCTCSAHGTTFVNVNVHKGNRKDLGRPTTTPKDNKQALMQELMR